MAGNRAEQMRWLFSLVIIACIFALGVRGTSTIRRIGPPLKSVKTFGFTLRSGRLNSTHARVDLVKPRSSICFTAICLGKEPLELEASLSEDDVAKFYALLASDLGDPSRWEQQPLCQWGDLGEIETLHAGVVDFELSSLSRLWLESKFQNELASLKAERDLRDSREVLRRTQADKSTTHLAEKLLEMAEQRSKKPPWPPRPTNAGGNSAWN